MVRSKMNATEKNITHAREAVQNTTTDEHRRLSRKAKGKRQKAKMFGSVVKPARSRTIRLIRHFCLLVFAAARVSASHAIFCLLPSDRRSVVHLWFQTMKLFSAPGVASKVSRWRRWQSGGARVGLI
jgi:hypothetical protein